MASSLNAQRRGFPCKPFAWAFISGIFACLGRAVKAKITSAGAIANIAYITTPPVHCNGSGCFGPHRTLRSTAEAAQTDVGLARSTLANMAISPGCTAVLTDPLSDKRRCGAVGLVREPVPLWIHLVRIPPDVRFTARQAAMFVTIFMPSL
jgi:hypothetical protein